MTEELKKEISEMISDLKTKEARLEQLTDHYGVKVDRQEGLKWTDDDEKFSGFLDAWDNVSDCIKNLQEIIDNDIKTDN